MSDSEYGTPDAVETDPIFQTYVSKVDPGAWLDSLCDAVHLFHTTDGAIQGT
jgi:hypothetical protein